MTENLVKSTDNLSKTEKSLNEAVNRGITSDRRLQVYLEQQAKLQSEIEKLTQSQSEIVAALKDIKEEEEDGEIKDEKDSDNSGMCLTLSQTGRGVQKTNDSNCFKTFQD